MKAEKQFSIKKLLACVLSLAVILSAFVFTSVSADTSTKLIDWDSNGGGYSDFIGDRTGTPDYIHITDTKTLSPSTDVARIWNHWGLTLEGYDKVEFKVYGNCEGTYNKIRFAYNNMEDKAGWTVFSASADDPTTVTVDVSQFGTDLSSKDYRFDIQATVKGAEVTADLYIGDVYGVVVEEAPAFPVTIDGAEQTYSGDQFTFPASTAAGFIAYTDGTNYYAANETVTITEAKDFTTLAYGALKMADGAAIRLSEKSGIRFYTPIDKAKIAELKNMGEVQLGTLIAPKDYLTKADLTFDLGTGRFVNVPYLATRYFEDEYVVGSLVDIKEANSTREFVGRGYIKVTLGGVSATIYADYAGGSVDNNARSIASIATAYKNDNAGYADLDEGLKALVDKWVAALGNSNTVAGIDTTKIEAAGKANYTVDKANNEIIVYVDNWDASATGDYVKFNVSGLKQGTISAYLGEGAEGWKADTRGAHYGVEIGGVVYWDSQWDDGPIKVETKGDYIGPDYNIVGKTMYELSSFAGNDSIQGEKQITADDLANITAVYIHPGYHMNGQYVHIRNVK